MFAVEKVIRMKRDPFIKQHLLWRLKHEHCLWSYDTESIQDLPDELVIEKTLLHLDLPEIDMLFQLYPFQKIKRIWMDFLIPQQEYLYTLNRFLAWYYFKIKRPDSYIKSMETRLFHKMFS